MPFVVLVLRGYILVLDIIVTNKIRRQYSQHDIITLLVNTKEGKHVIELK
jgi:hypothetical protein